MRALVITLAGDPYSERCAERCITTAREIGGIDVERFDAVPACRAEAEIVRRGLRWTWGEGGAGLRHHRYAGSLAPRIGCAMSHLALWERCAADGPLLILEHDAVFVRRFEPFAFAGACQINDPAGATRRGAWWSEQMRRRGPGVWPKTWVTRPEDRIPDGLAGNSAYALQPATAAHLCQLVCEFGVWPNDATLCAQLVPDLEEHFPFFTRVEQTESTTSR